MTRLAQEQVYNRLRNRGLSKRQSRIGSAIALCEAPSFTDPPLSDFDLVGDRDLVNETWGPSFSGFQIRSLKAHKGTGKYRDAEKLVEVNFAFDSAVTIFRQSGWVPWSTYTSGMFKAYLPDLFPPAQGTYVVVAGDTLAKIASKIGGFTWQDLARENGLHSPYPIFIGQTLMLPD